MLRVACVRLGRWKSTDFLRGRSKKMGSVHTRHTLGSRGRYKPYTRNHSLRDGNNVVNNHTKGGLGVKLGGGLFGLRIPRQHALSTMTADEYECAMHGHPNITNPYRGHLDEHPALARVMADASVLLHLVVLLPRVPRPSSSSSHEQQQQQQQQEEAQTASGAAVPQAWREVMDEVCAAVSPLHAHATTTAAHALLRTRLHVCTLDACVSMPASPWHGATSARTTTTTATTTTTTTATTTTSTATPDDVDASLVRALHTLYADLAKGRRVQLRPAHASDDDAAMTASRLRQPHARFLGAPLLASTRAPQPQQQRAGSSSSSDDKNDNDKNDNDMHGGVRALLRRLRLALPDALCVCLRPTDAAAAAATAPSPRPSRSGASRSHGALCMYTSPPEHIDACSSSSSSSATPSPALRRRDVDADEEVGVWGSRRNDLARLLRWHYCNCDPRAHNSDALPHDARRLSLVVLVDASKRVHTTTTTTTTTTVPSLLSPHFARELAHMGYHALPPRTLCDTLRELRAWTARRRSGSNDDDSSNSDRSRHNATTTSACDDGATPAPCRVVATTAARA